MSKSWEGGSTRAWRELRASVLASAGYRCQVHPDVCEAEQAPAHACTGRAPARGGHVHHLDGKARGDDPTRMRAACAACNLAIGEPGKRGDPAPQPRTRW